jgi:hypothetical protein
MSAWGVALAMIALVIFVKGISPVLEDDEDRW